MLSKRFQNDGKSTEYLNSSQVSTKRGIEEKIRTGVYHFEKASCLLCGMVDFQLLSEKDRYGLFHPVVICKMCGLIQQNPRMDDNSYQQFYGREYRMLYTGAVNSCEKLFQSQYARAKKIHQYLEENLKTSLSGKKVLEVGCGAGGILLYFREKGSEVFGFDIDEEDIRFGQERYKLSLQSGVLDSVSLPWVPDIVIYSHVVEHFLNPVEELRKLKSFLKEDCFIYVEVPGVLNLKQSYGVDFLRSLQNAHISYFTLATLTNMFIKAGYFFICGNEIIQSIWTIKENKYTSVPLVQNDYKTTSSFLRKLEWYRFIPMPYRLGFLLKEQVRRLLMILLMIKDKVS